jgi:SNF2 family DNA or RNA helicase
MQDLNNPQIVYEDKFKDMHVMMGTGFLTLKQDKHFKEIYNKDFYPFTFTPFIHQDFVLEYTWKNRYAALFLDMGLGKSKITLDTAGLLYLNEEIDGMIIVAPKGVYGNWIAKEIPKHLPESIPRKVVQWKTPLTKNKTTELNDLLSSKEKCLHIFVINIDALITDKGKFVMDQFLKKFKTMMVVDESTKIKSPKSKRSIATYNFGQKAKYKRILTGSPITKSPMDVYAQCAFLSKELLGFGNFYAFRNRYAVLKEITTFGGRSFKDEVGYQNLDELSDKLQTFSIRMTKEQCLDLPEKVYLTRSVEFTPEQRKYYNQLKDESIIILEDDEVSVTMVLTQILRCRQICSGYLATDAGNTIPIPNNRLAELEDTLEEINGKVIIWADFIQSIEQIVDFLSKKYGPKSVVSYYGATKDRETPIERFENDPDCRFFVSNPAVGSMGITLNAANYAIYYERDYNLINRLQSEARNYRIGQKNKITYIDLLIPGTIEEDIVEALINKYEISARVLRDRLLEWLKK